jgi:putative nucleotidyltransferase with HDIG domain
MAGARGSPAVDAESVRTQARAPGGEPRRPHPALGAGTGPRAVSGSSACPGCGGVFAAVEGPVHAYMTSSPGCWAAYGEVLAREFADPAWRASHRLSVDAYAVQHARNRDRRNRQSVAIHLLSLCALLERGIGDADARALLSRAARGAREWPTLSPPARFETTVADVALARDAAEHLALVRRWAESAWSGWAHEHARVRAWLDRGTRVERGPPPVIGPDRSAAAALSSAQMPAGATSLPSREEALALLHEWVQAEPLRRHCLAVAAAMRDQAHRRGGEEELWGLAGLLHDLDYERYPDLETGHPRMGMAELERLGYPPELVRAVASHADHLGVSRDSAMERALAAVDELSGFVLACAYVRPQGLDGMTPRSVRKKLRQPSFAPAVNREDVRRGAEELGVELDELIEQVIAALAVHAEELGVRRHPR